MAWIRWGVDKGLSDALAFGLSAWIEQDAVLHDDTQERLLGVAALGRV